MPAYWTSIQFFALLLYPLVICGESASQQLPSAEEVLNRYAKALGGREAILKHSSMTVIGTLELPNKKGVLDQIHYYKNGKRLEKISLPDGRVSLSGFDGKIGWEVYSAGETSLHLGDEARTWARDADMHYPAHVLDYFRSMQVLEATKFQGHTCYCLALQTGAGSTNTSTIKTQDCWLATVLVPNGVAGLGIRLCSFWTIGHSMDG